METQLVKACERNLYKKMSYRERLIHALVLAEDVYASIFSYRRTSGIFPNWAQEALRINDWQDIENLEQHIMANETDDSFLKKVFLINKEKLQRCIKKIEDKHEVVTKLRPGPTLQPGASALFPFTIKAPHLFRSNHAELQFRVEFCNSGSEKVISHSVTKRILLYPSAFAVPTGSMLGATCGHIIRLALLGSVQAPSPGIFGFCGSILLGLVMALLTSRKPEVTKVITVEDFLGGFIIGALVGIFSQNFLEKLGTVFK